MLSKQNTITSDMWADVFSANETYGRTSSPPPRAHLRPDLYPSVSHKAAATRADTYGDTSFSPRCSARLASPLQAQASQLRWEPPVSFCLFWITQNFYTEQEKQLQTFRKNTLNVEGIKLVEVISAGFYFQRFLEVLLFNALLHWTWRALMDEKWVIILGLTQNNGGQSTMEQARFQGEPSKGRNLFQRSSTSELRLKDEY